MEAVVKRIQTYSAPGITVTFDPNVCIHSGVCLATLPAVFDDLSRPAVHALLQEHLQNMHAWTPAESVHALDLASLLQPEITFWTAWDDDLLVGCGALKELDSRHGEVKSMRTPSTVRRRGAGRAILEHIVAEARTRGYDRLSLETGAAEVFRPAQRLYESAGFVRCGPFDGYVEDPNSLFFTLEL
jgi:putative acetyltransferase